MTLAPLLAELQAGDVLLTGQRGGLSSLITWAGGASVSHALLVVADGVAVEARDARWDLQEQGRGIRLIRLDSLPALGLSVVHAVRPIATPDALAIRLWASEVVSRATPFASVGLTAMAPLLLAAQLEARLHSLGPFEQVFGPVVRRRRRRLAELVADGTHRVICAELVYRGLLAGGVEVDLSVAQFATAMEELPDPVESDGDRQPGESHGRSRSVRGVSAEADADAAGLPENDVWSGEEADPLHVSEQELLARAVPARVLKPGDLPRPRWRYAIRSARAGIRQLFRRSGKDFPGDRADLVTPADLLRSPTMAQLWEWRGHRK